MELGLFECVPDASAGDEEGCDEPGDGEECGDDGIGDEVGGDEEEGGWELEGVDLFLLGGVETAV